jgi:ABC-2 type transport system ATP-binding protein
MSHSVLTVKSMIKQYGEQIVLKGLNWQVKQGDVIGLLGKNGAGKSTLLNSMLGIYPSYSGEVTIFGEPVEQLSAATKGRIGYVPQTNDEPAWMTVEQLLNFKQRFYPTWNQQKVDELIGRWEVDLSKPMNELSQGQAQRVMIILALAHEPELIIFDEPAASLDPAGRRDFLKEIINIAAEGDKTVIFSTHITSDLERVANKVAILHEGVIKHFDELDAVKENIVRMSIQGEDVGNIEVPNVLKSLSQSEQGIANVLVEKVDQAWIESMKAKGLNISLQSMGLEDIFLEVTA